MSPPAQLSCPNSPPSTAQLSPQHSSGVSPAQLSNQLQNYSLAFSLNLNKKFEWKCNDIKHLENPLWHHLDACSLLSAIKVNESQRFFIRGKEPQEMSSAFLRKMEKSAKAVKFVTTATDIVDWK